MPVGSVQTCTSVLTQAKWAKFEAPLVSAMVAFQFILHHLLNVRIKKKKGRGRQGKTEVRASKRKVTKLANTVC